jgi:hypothetical protein
MENYGNSPLSECLFYNMPSFEREFRATLGKPILYKGYVLSRMDEFPVSHGETLQLEIESTESDWKQGVALFANGGLSVDGERISPNKDGVIIWQEEITGPVPVKIMEAAKSLRVTNAWQDQQGHTLSCYHGAAMRIQELDDGRRYWCNDGHPDDNFTDIVFTIRRSKIKE